MKIRIEKLNFRTTQPKLIGSVRVRDEIFNKISHLANANKVSKAEIIRVILEEVFKD